VRTNESLPNLEQEALLWKQGSAFVFGIDEAGRGCLAGPVCAAVAAWSANLNAETVLSEIRDSKQMTLAQREAAFDPVMERSLAKGVGWASAQEIDRWNILRATYLAVARAMEQALRVMFEKGLFDGKDFSLFAFLTDGSHPLLSHSRFFLKEPDTKNEFHFLKILLQDPVKEICLIKGDSRVYSIASASVLAKVHRDRHMLVLDKEFPAYNFADHKGYSTEKHIKKLRESGPCSEHRRSYAPVAEAAAMWQTR